MDGPDSRLPPRGEGTSSERKEPAHGIAGDVENLNQTEAVQLSGSGSDDSASDGKDPTIGDTDRPVNLATPELIDLQRQLVDVGLMTTGQWSQAVSTVGKSADLKAFLTHLTQIESSRTLPSEDCTPVLTGYQAKLILDGNARKLWFQHYLILDQLGKGGMGEVLRALNCNLYRIEAVKMIKPQSNTGPLETAARRRFKREAEILAALDHPYITKVWNAGFQDDLAFIAMEYVRGKDMEQIVREHKAENKPVPISWAVEKIIQVAEALQHAHERRVMHRDIKPSNIMLTDDGGLKVLDLGIGRLLGDGRDPGGDSNPTLTVHGGPLGTPAFMPPEQWYDATSVTPESDIYSLGITLFYIIAGELPFKGRNVMFQHMNDPAPRLRKFRPEAPRQLEAVIRKMLAKEAKGRYASAAQAIEALRPFQRKTKVRRVIPWRQFAIGAGIAAGVLGISAGGAYVAPKAKHYFESWTKSPEELQLAEFNERIARAGQAPSPTDLFRRGCLLYQNFERHQEAIADFERALGLPLNRTSEKAEIHFHCGQAYLRLFDESNALSHFEDAVSAQNDNGHAHLEIARLRAKLGNFEQAILSARQARIHADRELQRDRRIALESAARFEAGASLNQWFPRLAAGNEWNKIVELFEQARQDDWLGDADQAPVRTLELAAHAYHELGKQAADQGKTQAAAAKLEAAVQIAPTAQRCLDAGRLALDTKRLDQAIGLFSQALDIGDQPDQAAQTYTLRGEASFLQEQWESAIRDWEQATELQPSLMETLRPRLFETHQRNADYLAARGDFDAAVASYRRCLEIDPAAAHQVYPALASAELELADRLLQQQPPRVDDVISTLTASPASDPEFKDRVAAEIRETTSATLSRAHRLRSSQRLQKSEFESAIADLNAAARIAPDDALDGQRAEAYLEWGRSVDSPGRRLELFQQAAELAPTSQAFEAIGDALVDLKRFKSADDAYLKSASLTDSQERRAALERKRGNAFAADGLAAISNNQYEKAVEKLDRALDLLTDRNMELEAAQASALEKLADTLADQDPRGAAERYERSAFLHSVKADQDRARGKGAKSRLDVAIALRDSQRYELALDEIGKALANDANLGQAYFERGVLVADDDPRQAAADFQKAIKKGYATAEVYWRRASALENAGASRVEMILDLKKATQLDPDNEKYVARWKQSVAKALDDKLPVSDDPQDYLRWANDFAAAGDWAAAAQCYDGLKSLKSQIEDRDARRQAAKAYSEHGKSLYASDPEHAIARLESALELDETLAQPRLVLGKLLLEQNRADAAATQFRLCELPEARQRLADVLLTAIGPAKLKAGRPDEAQAAFAEALSLVPDSASGLLGRAESLLQLRDYENAIQDCRSVRKLDQFPKELADRIESAANLQLGRLRLQENDADAAITRFKDAARLKESLADDADFRADLAKAYDLQATKREQSGDWAGAIASLKSALDVSPSEAEVEDRLARAYRKRAALAESERRWQDALVDYEILLDQYAPGDDALLLSCGNVFVQLSEFEKAQPRFEAAENSDDPNIRSAARKALADLYLRFADSARKQRDFAGAKELYLKAIDRVDEESKPAVSEKAAETLLAQSHFEQSVDLKAQLLVEAADYDPGNRQEYLRQAADIHQQAAQEHFEAATIESYDLSVKHFRKAMEYVEEKAAANQREIARAYYNSAALANQKSDFQEAIRRYAKAAELKEFVTDEYLSRIFLSRGHVRLSVREYSDAIDDYAETLKLDPKNAAALEWRGLVRGAYAPQAQRDVKAAMADLEKAADFEPEGVGLYALRRLVGWRCSDRTEWRDGEKAVKYAKLLCKRTENKVADDLVALASAYAESGDKDEAVKWMDEAIKLSATESNRTLREHYAAGNKPPTPGR